MKFLLAFFVVFHLLFSLSAIADRASQPSVESLAASILRMVSTSDWTPKKYRGQRGEKRVLQDALLVLTESRAAGVDPLLVAALIANESGFNTDALGAAGELGLSQIHPAYAAEHGCPNLDRLQTDARYNVACGAARLAFWRKRCGADPRAFLAAYNSGSCSRGQDYADRVLRLAGMGRQLRMAEFAEPAHR